MKPINIAAAILAFGFSSVPSLAGELTITYGQRFRGPQLRLVPWAIFARVLDRAPFGRAVITICDESTL